MSNAILADIDPQANATSGVDMKGTVAWDFLYNVFLGIKSFLGPDCDTETVSLLKYCGRYIIIARLDFLLFYV